ncbi:DUF3102 domain-containing protein [Paenibacillus mesotrionivorans]|uniref:DUF3102 domain-containing protein n=1 Tax=Paenibacillus mesotrionivorans TaxID=3160968 RepID=A0ACC7NTK4_9BACL
MAKQLVTLSSDLTVITAEINSYKRIAGDAIFEIGRRLKHVKENDLVHGQFGEWLEQLDIHPRIAQQMMKVSDHSQLKTSTYSHLGLKALYEIATLPPEERERDHTLKSGETKSPAEMTVRELREVKEALRKAEDTLKAAEEARKMAEDRAEQVADENAVLRGTVESLASTPPPLPRIEVQTEYVADPTLSDRLKRYEARYGVYNASSRRFNMNQREHKRSCRVTPFLALLRQKPRRIRLFYILTSVLNG